MITNIARIAFATGLMGIVALSTPLFALDETTTTDVVPANVRSQQEEARQALKEGLVRPLEEVLSEARKLIRGDIVEIEFEREENRFIYEIEYVAEDGHLMEIKIDATTLAVISHGEEEEDED